MEDKLILVNLKDEEIGEACKMEAHEKSLLHRAFSVFLYNDNKLLIQKRAAGKYHSGGLWANTCCSHPRVGEELKDAVSRRLKEEVGVCCEVKHLQSFVYRADYGQLSEYEIDHIFIGEYKGDFSYNHEEIEEMQWADMDELARDMETNPTKYAAWFITAFPIVYNHLQNN